MKKEIKEKGSYNDLTGVTGLIILFKKFSRFFKNKCFPSQPTHQRFERKKVSSNKLFKGTVS